MAYNEYLICSTNPRVPEAVWGDQAACDSARKYGTGVVLIIRNTGKGGHVYCDLMVAEKTGGKDPHTGLARVSPDDLANALYSFTQYPDFCWTDHYINPRTGIVRTLHCGAEPHQNEVYLENDGSGDLWHAVCIARNVLEFLKDPTKAKRRLRDRFAVAGTDGSGGTYLGGQDNSPKMAPAP